MVHRTLLRPNIIVALISFMLCMTGCKTIISWTSIAASGKPLYYKYGPYSGTVVDMDTGEPIEGALVYLDAYTSANSLEGIRFFFDSDSMSAYTYTDKDGKYYLKKQRIKRYGSKYGAPIHTFVICKRGYICYDPARIFPCNQPRTDFKAKDNIAKLEPWRPYYKYDDHKKLIPKGFEEELYMQNIGYELNKIGSCASKKNLLIKEKYGDIEAVRFGPFTGKVVDEDSGEPIEEALVYLSINNPEIEIEGIKIMDKEPVLTYALTDKNGEYSIPAQEMKVYSFKKENVEENMEFFVYKKNYVAYSKDSIFPCKEKRTDFKIENNEVRLAKWELYYTHFDHYEFMPVNLKRPPTDLKLSPEYEFAAWEWGKYWDEEYPKTSAYYRHVSCKNKIEHEKLRNNGDNLK